jgi:hypothetical protein
VLSRFGVTGPGAAVASSEATSASGVAPSIIRRPQYTRGRTRTRTHEATLTAGTTRSCFISALTLPKQHNNSGLTCTPVGDIAEEIRDAL